METKIIWHFNMEKKKRGTTFAKKDEYELAIQFEEKAQVDQDLKRQVKLFLKSRYHVSVHQLTYRDKPLGTVCKLFGGRDKLCEELNITVEQLCELNVNFTNPHIKSQMLISYLLPVLSDQDFANWFYSTVYNLYNDIKEPLLIHPNELPSTFYQWLYDCGYYGRLKPYMVGDRIPNAIMIGDYIYEHRGDYAQMYSKYSELLANHIESLYSHRPSYIQNVKQRTTQKLKRHNVMITHRLESLGIKYKSYNSIFSTVSPYITDSISVIAKDIGFNEYDMLYSIILDSVEQYAKKPSYKSHLTVQYLRNQEVKLNKLK